MDQLNFSTNWNNKLDCTAFTTLRLPNEKYKLGELFQITLNGVEKGIGRIISITYINIDNINEYIARLDTGYSTDECKVIIRNIYPTIDFIQQPLVLLLIGKI